VRQCIAASLIHIYLCLLLCQPPAGEGYVNLRTIRLAENMLSSDLPESWSLFQSLEELDIRMNLMVCLLRQSVNGALVCGLPNWLQLLPTLQQLPVGTDTTDYVAGVHCPLIGLLTSGYSNIAVDPEYLALTACSCDSGYFGHTQTKTAVGGSLL
jgi:hypothetical protein